MLAMRPVQDGLPIHAVFITLSVLSSFHHGSDMSLILRARQFTRQLPASLPLLAGVLACWWLVASLTTLLSPRAPVLAVLEAPQPEAAAGNVALQHWFGSSQQAAAAQAAPPLQVLGVLGGGQGSRQDFAIVLENGQPQALRVGEQSPGGWWLRRVDGSGVVIQQQGGAEVSVALSRAVAGSPSPAGGAPAVAATTAVPTPRSNTVTPQFMQPPVPVETMAAPLREDGPSKD